MLTALGQTLFEAVESSDQKRVELLLSKGANLSERDANGRSILHLAASRGDDSIIELLVKAGAKVDVTDGKRDTPLMVALRESREECCLPLMTTTTVRKRDKEGSTPLHTIISRGFKKALVKALQCKAVLDRKDRGGKSAYVLALETKDRQVIDIVYTHLAKRSVGDFRARHPLHHAAGEEPLAIVSLLIAAGFSVDERDDEGLTPLAHAIKNGRINMACHLVALGANVLAKDIRGNTLVHLANEEPSPKIGQRGNSLTKVLEWVLCQGLSIDEKNEKGQTALLRRVWMGAHTNAIIDPYLIHGAQLDTRDLAGNNLLHVCLYDKMAQYLVSKGLDVNEENSEGLTPLQIAQRECRQLSLINFLRSSGSRPLALPEVMAAVTEGNLAELRKVLTCGADVDEADPDGVTALMVAAYNGNSEMVRLLLRAKASVTCEARRLPNHLGPWDSPNCRWYQETSCGSKAGMSALHIASAKGFLEIVELLVESGAPLDRTPRTVGTPLAIAARLGHEKIVQLLIDSGSPFNSNYESDPLNWAIQGGQVEVVKMLIAAGVSIRSGPHARTSSLDVAVQSNMTEIARTLVEGGAQCHDVWFEPTFYGLLERDFKKAMKTLKASSKSTELLDSEGRTALHIAALLGAVEVIEYLVDERDMAVDQREWLYGATPLHLASMMGRAPAVSALVERGADEKAQTNQGFTASDFASASSFLVGLSSLITGRGPRGKEKELLKEMIRLESKILELKQHFLSECDKDYDSYEWKHIGRPIEEDIIKLRNELRKLCSKK